MKLLIIIAAVLSTVIARSIETETGRFECIANYLRDKNLLDSSFKYYVHSEPLECDSFIAELSRDLLKSIKDPSSSEENEEAISFKKSISENFECVEEQLIALKYPEEILKVVIYGKSTKTSKKIKKKLVADAENTAAKKLSLALSVCAPETYFGMIFDSLLEDDTAEDTIEEKQTDYCARKYAVDKNLIDATRYTINLNPDNIDLNFECQDKVDEMLEGFEGLLKDGFGEQSKKGTRCINRTIRDGKFTDYMLKIALISEITMTADDKKAFRDEFVVTYKKFNLDLIKCLE